MRERCGYLRIRRCTANLLGGCIDWIRVSFRPVHASVASGTPAAPALTHRTAVPGPRPQLNTNQVSINPGCKGECSVHLFSAPCPAFAAGIQAATKFNVPITGFRRSCKPPRLPFFTLLSFPDPIDSPQGPSQTSPCPSTTRSYLPSRDLYRRLLFLLPLLELLPLQAYPHRPPPISSLMTPLPPLNPAQTTPILHTPPIDLAPSPARSFL